MKGWWPEFNTVETILILGNAMPGQLNWAYTPLQ